MNSDLQDLVVVSVEQAVAAPYLSSRLADAGARVIKVERPEGDFARGYDRLVKGESAYFVWLNRDKESICVDLKEPADQGVLRAMIEEADVFVQNLAPGVIDRLGFAPDVLRRRDKRLITCSISGYGVEGPYRDLKAYDLLVQAESGLSTITGNEHGMARVGVSVCAIVTGAFAMADRAEMIERLERARIAYGRVSSMQDLADHPQNRFVTVETPSGLVRYLAPGARFDGEAPEFRPVPALGEHSEALRREFGGALESAA